MGEFPSCVITVISFLNKITEKNLYFLFSFFHLLYWSFLVCLNLPLVSVSSSGRIRGGLCVVCEVTQGFPGASSHCVPLAWRPDSYPLSDQESGCSWWEANWPVSQRKRLRLLENNAQYSCGWTMALWALLPCLCFSRIGVFNKIAVVFLLFVIEKHIHTQKRHKITIPQIENCY